MKRTITAALALTAVLCGSPLIAADMPLLPGKAPPILGNIITVPAFSWNGFYVGANAGYGVQDVSGTNSASGNDAIGSILAGLTPANLQNDPRGPVLGGQLGWRHQNGAFVFGVEEMIDWAHITNTSSTGSNAGGIVAGSSMTSQQVDWLSFTNLSLGITPAQHFMAYVTGGLAVGGVKTNSSAAVAVGGIGLAGSQGLDQTRVGWNAGLGAEFAMTSALSLRADARYYDLGTPSGSYFTNGAPGVAPLTIDYSNPTKGYIGTVGLNWKFPQ